MKVSFVFNLPLFSRAGFKISTFFLRLSRSIFIALRIVIALPPHPVKYQVLNVQCLYDHGLALKPSLLKEITSLFGEKLSSIDKYFKIYFQDCTIVNYLANRQKKIKIKEEITHLEDDFSKIEC